ncbi:MAG: hypothetical protein HOP30_16570 [Cyclobacteriaceae bacterium]|nr:hypothetical protein [Cyclobacteriaceae bacterium]
MRHPEQINTLKFTWTRRLALFTPLIMIISIVTLGGGHGTPLPTLLCYPVSFLLRVFSSGGGPWVWALLLGQFPLYGLILDLGEYKSKQSLFAWLLAIQHIVLILIASSDADFWKQ